MQRGHGQWDHTRTPWDCSRHWPKSHQGARGSSSRAKSDLLGVPRLFPRLLGPSLGQRGGWEGRGGRGGGKGLSPSAALWSEAEPCSWWFPRAGGSSQPRCQQPSPCPPRCRAALAAPQALCGPGSQWQNCRQLNPSAEFGGLQHQGGSCLAKRCKSKPELSYRLGISAPSHPGAGGAGHSSAQPSPWGTRGAGAGTSAGVCPVCSLSSGHRSPGPAASRGAPSPARPGMPLPGRQDPDPPPPAPLAPVRGNSWHEGAGQVWPRDMAEG